MPYSAPKAMRNVIKKGVIITIEKSQKIKKIARAQPSKIKPKLLITNETDFLDERKCFRLPIEEENMLATPKSAEPATNDKNKRSATVKPVCNTGKVALWVK